MPNRRRLLIVSPSFHEYWRSIERAFAQLGYDVATCRYDQRNTTQKIAHKVAVELPSKLGVDRGALVRRSITNVAISAVQGFDPTIVLAVKGDQLDLDFHQALEQKKVRSAVWIYDELANTEFTPEVAGLFGGVASYSRRDTLTLQAQGVPCIHTPDAFDPTIRFSVRPTNEIVHIGAAYSARIAAMESLQRAGIPVRSYGRAWSRHPYDVLRTWGARRPAVPGGREMPRSEAQGLMAGAPAALNIHGSHDGFNMRTFEAAGAGAVQLIDRSDVQDLYEPGKEILPFNSPDELIDLSRRAIRDDRWGDKIRAAARRHTLAEHTFLHRARQLEQLWA